MARQCGVGQSTVSRICRAFRLQPYRSETFKLSADPLFIDKVWGHRWAVSEPAGPSMASSWGLAAGRPPAPYRAPGQGTMG